MLLISFFEHEGESKLFSTNNYSQYQLFEIDYYRIKHSIFYQPNKYFKVVDSYQLYLLKVVSNLESILQIYPRSDLYLVYWINISLSYLIRNTDIHIYYNCKQLYDFSKDSTVVNVLKTLYFYFHDVKQSNISILPSQNLIILNRYINLFLNLKN